MMRRTLTLTGVALGAVALMSTPALGGYSITQGPGAPTYTDFSLNFDEAGGPTGNVLPDGWLATHGITLDSGVGGGGFVTDWDPILGWNLGDGNAWAGGFGAFMTFDQDLTAMSVQVWDPSGPWSPFGGGLAIYLFNDGMEVATASFDASWGGVGDTWHDMVADGGDVFDEVRILGWGMTPETYMDNLTWNVIPGPGALAFLALGALASRRRRS